MVENDGLEVYRVRSDCHVGICADLDSRGVPGGAWGLPNHDSDGGQRVRNLFGKQVRLERHRFSAGKHPLKVKTMGFARRNRGNGATNWTVLAKHFPAYREQIKRLTDPVKLMALIQRLEKKYDIKTNAHFPG